MQGERNSGAKLNGEMMLHDYSSAITHINRHISHSDKFKCLSRHTVDQEIVENSK